MGRAGRGGRIGHFAKGRLDALLRLLGFGALVGCAAHGAAHHTTDSQTAKAL